MHRFCMCVAMVSVCVVWPGGASASQHNGPSAAPTAVTGTCEVAAPAGAPASVSLSGDPEALWRSAAALASGELIARSAQPRGERDGAVSAISSLVNDRALDELLRRPHGLGPRWAQAPELVVLMSVMEYQSGRRTEYQATTEYLTDAEAGGLVADLNDALALLTGNTFTAFAAIRRESVPAGTQASVVQAGRIVVGRYRGVRDRLDTIGLGARFGRAGGTISGGSIILDSDYDRTSSMRRLLRTHELGHALGYNHVESRVSIMNPRIGPEPTEVDRRAAVLAFQGATRVSLARPCPEH